MMRIISLIGIAFLACLVSAHAELAPAVYENLKKQAPEELRITITEVVSKRTKGLPFSRTGTWTETVTARVDGVTRSNSGVKPGDVIVIRYNRAVHGNGWAGPAPAPKLEKASTLSAWLKREADQTFALAAHGRSFAR